MWYNKISVAALVLSISLMPWSNLGTQTFAQTNESTNAQTIEEQLEKAKESIANAQESGAFGAGLGSVSTQIQNITYHNCDLPITNVGLIETSNIFGSGIQIMGNVHNNFTHLIEGVGIVVELYNEANSLIGVETGQTEPSSMQPGDYSPFKIVSTAKVNASSMVFGCSYSIYDPMSFNTFRPPLISCQLTGQVEEDNPSEDEVTKGEN